MKTLLSLAVLVPALLLLRSDGEDAAPEPLADLAWLAGDWVGKVQSGNDWIAHYTDHRGGVLLGTTKEFEGERLTLFEFERFEATDEGVFVTPYPRGREARTFRLTELDLDETRAVFESPVVDFPTRLVYDRDGDRLAIQALMERDGEWIGFRVDLERR